MVIDYWRFACANPRFLGFGLLLAFLSSAGQTYVIGVFGTHIQTDFGLDPGSWGRIYMIGTLASALMLNWSGPLLDRLDLRLFTCLCLAGLCVACLTMGFASTPLMLVLAVFLLRHFGQGLTSHASITSMARYHDADRGKAIAIAAIGFSLGEALLPVAGLYAAQTFGWRQTFYVIGIGVLTATLIALWLLKGHSARHAAHRKDLSARESNEMNTGSYTRRQVLADRRFYFILPAFTAPAMIGTALFFFPAEIAQAKEWTPLWVTGNYWIYSIAAVASTIYSGVLIDRFSARRVVPWFLIPLIFSLVFINLSGHAFLVWPYLLLMGVSMGVYFTGLSALWAEMYGAKNLGAIKSMTNAVMVFSSALGPALMGSLLQWGFSFLTVSFLFITFCILATGMLIYGLRIPSR
ncbi:MAG: MFS transporter [Pseudomonadota bacterium]